MIERREWLARLEKILGSTYRIVPSLFHGKQDVVIPADDWNDMLLAAEHVRLGQGRGQEPQHESDDKFVEQMVTAAAANIVDVMSGGDRSWREKISSPDILGSTFLDSADWQQALAYADAAHDAYAAAIESESNCADEWMERWLRLVGEVDRCKSTIAQRDAEIDQLREALATARRDGWIAGRAVAEKLFEEEKRSAQKQIEDNDEYVARVGGDAWPSNRLCHERIARCDRYLVSIRALAPPTAAEGDPQ